MPNLLTICVLAYPSWQSSQCCDWLLFAMPFALHSIVQAAVGSPMAALAGTSPAAVHALHAILLTVELLGRPTTSGILSN